MDYGVPRPCRGDDAEITRQSAIAQLIALGEAEEAGEPIELSDQDHMLQVILIRYVPSDVPAESLGTMQPEIVLYLYEIALRLHHEVY